MALTEDPDTYWQSLLQPRKIVVLLEKPLFFIEIKYIVRLVAFLIFNQCIKTKPVSQWHSLVSKQSHSKKDYQLKVKVNSLFSSVFNGVFLYYFFYYCYVIRERSQWVKNITQVDTKKEKSWLHWGRWTLLTPSSLSK